MKINKSEQGFVTLIVVLVIIIVAAICFAYMRVKGAQEG